MPIQVTCSQCRQSLAAPDSLAGKAAKCPKCSNIIQVPAPQKPVAGLSPLTPINSPAPAAPAPSAFDMASQFGTPTGGGVQAGGSVCPGCYSSLPPNAVLCVKCGLNLKTGQQMKTVRGGGSASKLGSGDGHTDAASMLLERAAQSIQEDIQSEKAKVNEGLPWWSYVIMLLLVVGFLITMTLLPVSQSMMAVGGVLMFFGWLMAMVGNLTILKLSFDDDVITLLLCLFVPFYVFIFIFSRWDTAGTYFLLWIGGLVVMGLGFGAFVYGQNWKPDPDSITSMLAVFGLC